MMKILRSKGRKKKKKELRKEKGEMKFWTWEVEIFL